MVVFTDVSKEGVLRLIKKGFKKEAIKTIYEDVRLTKGKVTVILYTSGKLLLQGNPEEIKAILPQLKKMKMGAEERMNTFRKENGVIIGSDESLKGDTFGGMVVAAVKANDLQRQKLKEIGVMDSKLLNDVEILPMAEKIRSTVECEVKSILPIEYNAYIAQINQTELLNRMHEEVAQYLGQGKHVVDKYPGCDVGTVQVEKGEFKYVEIAAASVLARAAALKQLDYLSVQAGFTLPKGSTHVKLALMELKHRGLEFNNFVKINFNNVVEFLKEEK